MGVAENIDALLVKFDITAEALARIAEVQPPTVSRWRHGAVPREEPIRKMADFFGLTRDDIVSDKYGLAAKEHGRSVPSVMMPGAMPIAAGEYEYVPLRGRVHCGPWTAPESLEAREELVLAPQWVVDGDPDAYAVIAESDCMNRVIVPDQVGFIWPNAEPRNNSVVIASIDGGDALMRRMFRTAERLILSPDSTNPEHRDIVIEWASGQAVEFGGRLVHAQTNGEIG